MKTYLLKTNCNDMYIVEEESPEKAVSEHIEHYDQHESETFTVYELNEPLGEFGTGPRKVRRIR